MDLKTTQDRVQSNILTGGDDILEHLVDGPTANRTNLFQIYRNAYVLRLIEFLQHDYEQTHAYLGDEEFEALCRSYIAANTSHTTNARWFGSNLPNYLAQTEPYNTHKEIVELASLEKALNDAFDGPDAEPLTTDDLAGIPPENWPDLVLQPHTTAARLRFSTNAADIWLALKDEEEPPEAKGLDETQQLLVWRQDETPRFRVLGYEEAMMWDEAVKGVRFGGLCEMVATHGGEDGADLRAATYLQTWLAAGLLKAATSSGG